MNEGEGYFLLGKTDWDSVCLEYKSRKRDDVIMWGGVVKRC